MGIETSITCVGLNQAELMATGGISYEWNNGVTTANNTVSPLVTTTYTVTVTRSNGCKSTSSVQVVVNKVIPVVDAGRIRH
ncbi:MAG: hypothetical protein IPO14_04570 [Saprospiraceae bacterium]|nr:hypothetical protein [Saprospiraceae bacterium]